jgi:hypothetical protein
MEVLPTALAEASATLNYEMHRFPWRKDGAIAAVTVTPLGGSPETPAWYEPRKGDVTINLLAIYNDEKMVRKVLRDLAGPGKVPKVVRGMMAHETAHSRWSVWTHPEGVTPAVAATMTMFEELRIEKRAADWTDVARNDLRHCFHWLLRRIVDGDIDTRPRAVAHTWALIFGRYLASIAALAEVQPIDDVARTALGDDTVDMLREVLEEATNTDSVLRLAELAQEWLDTLGSDDDEAGVDPPLVLHGGAEDGSAESGGKPEGADEPDTELAEVLEQTVAEIADAVEDTPMPEPEDALSDPAEYAAKVFGHGKGKDHRSSSWVSRDPSPALRTEALRFARTLEALSLPSVALRHAPDVLPPGRLRGREAVRQSAERSMGLMSTATPWQRTKRQRTTTKPIIVGCMTDTSGSMREAQEFVADFAWVMATAGQRVGARTAAVTFGSIAEMVTRPQDIPQKVRERTANGGREVFDKAAAAMEGVLHLSESANAAKVLFIVSDGHLVIEGEKARARRWIERWTKGGTLVVWIGCDTWGVIGKGARKPGDAVNLPYNFYSSRRIDSAEMLQKMTKVITDAARGMT